MRLLRAISRFIAGLTFIFSGFVKLIDPVGVGLIMEEYLKSAGIGVWRPLTEIAGAFLSGIELITGIAILLGLRMIYACKAIFFLTLFFTVLTFILALFNPLTDCGCFGEAIKLTNWETFIKNIILLLFVTVLLVQRREFIPVAPPKKEWIMLSVFALFTIALGTYSYRNLPLIDFMEFKVGTNIKNRLEFSYEEGVERFQTVLIYEKSGKREEFLIDNLPDSSYTFVDSKTVEIKASRSYKPMDFAVSDRAGNYVTDSLLSLEKPLFVVVSPIISNLKLKQKKRINQFYDTLANRGVEMIMLTGSDWRSVDSAKLRGDLKMKIFHTDYKTLLTLNRSNGGVVFLHSGTVILKWSWRGLPIDRVDSVLEEDPELLSARAGIFEQLSAELTAFILLMIIAITRYIFRIVYNLKTHANREKEESQET